jgi:xylan 1,4-beta-xylosidase
MSRSPAEDFVLVTASELVTGYRPAIKVPERGPKMIRGVAIFCGAVLCCGAALNSTETGLRELHIDAAKVTGEIRSLQGLNGPPSPVMAGLPNLVHQYQDLRVDLVRTHDFMGPTEIDSKFQQSDAFLKWLIPDETQRAGVVQAGNAAIIFPDGAADPEKMGSYNFGPTDKVLAAIHDSGAEVYYRVGRSFGANINPPADFDKFANVVKHIAMHYNQGWDHGYHYKIRYWEFWNEPELFWSGTPEQFYSLYEKTARALKSVDPMLKVGGDAKALSYSSDAYREGFIDYCRDHQVPLDFYSWHNYTDATADPDDAIRVAKIIRHVLDTHGFPHAESILSEWNISADFTDSEVAALRGMPGAAYASAELSYLQGAPVDHAQFYRGDAAWMGLFDSNAKYFKSGYVFKAMGQLLDTPLRLAVSGTDTFGFAALAGRSADGKKLQILITNYALPAGWKGHIMQPPPDAMKQLSGLGDLSNKVPPPRTNIVYRDNGGYHLTIDHLPWGAKKFSMKRFRLNDTQDLALVDEKSETGPSLTVSAALPPDAVELIVLEAR